MRQVKSIQELKSFINENKNQPFVIFKHSFRCPISGTAFDEFQAFTKKHPEIPAAWLDVINSRDVSNLVAQESGVTHQSPQVIFYKKGKVMWNASHSSITLSALEKNTNL